LKAGETVVTGKNDCIWVKLVGKELFFPMYWFPENYCYQINLDGKLLAAMFGQTGGRKADSELTPLYAEGGIAASPGVSQWRLAMESRIVKADLATADLPLLQPEVPK
jgi:hypothetical protein